MSNPALAKGTRDFGPRQMAQRNFILENIAAVFKKFGFSQIETPSIEKLDVLTGKYGDEGDQLIFKILNSGDFLKKVQTQDLENNDLKKLTPQLCEKALRYDLTVPFARFVTMSRNELTLPFKRFQIQPVWRADRPQKGRYREFVQCDADVVGTDSLLCEVDILAMINESFKNLGIDDFTIKINNRKILSGLAELIDAGEQESDLFVAIDKLDKIGIEKVLEELSQKGFSATSLDQIKQFLSISGSNQEVLTALSSLLHDSENGQKGIEELQTILSLYKDYELPLNTQIEVTLARGLSYYTGAILEVVANNVKIGSVSGGGRYDNLTGVFGFEGVSGVGISFGIDRIHDVMTELDLFGEILPTNTEIILCHFDEASFKYAVRLAGGLRKAGVSTEVYPDHVKLKKQLNYANKKAIPFAGIIGDDEVSQNKITLKDLNKGEQHSFTKEECIAFINKE